MITLTTDQQEGLNKAVNFCQTATEYSNPFVFSGFAGTGKTTTIAALTAELDRLDIPFQQLSPTHRACKVLMNASGNDTRTVHSALYKPRTTTKNSPVSSVVVSQMMSEKLDKGLKVHDNKTGKTYLKIFAYKPDDIQQKQGHAWYDDSIRKAENYMKRKKFTHKDGFFISLDPVIEETYFEKRTPQDIYRDFGGCVFIVDESSMLKSETELAFANLANPVIFVGDPAQLPPVYGPHELAPSFHMTDLPDFELTEIMRSKVSTGIPDIGSDIRNGRALKSKYGNGVSVRYTNASNTDYGINAATMEGIVNYSIKHFDGAKDLQFLACTNRNVALINDLVRRNIGYPSQPFKNFPSMVPRPGERLISLGREPAAGIEKNEILTVKDILECEIKTSSVRGVKTDIVYKGEAVVLTEMGKTAIIDFTTTQVHGALKVDFAYAITTHKAQGSSFPKVVWIDDTVLMQKEHLIKYAYTGATRAEDQLLFISNGKPTNV